MKISFGEPPEINLAILSWLTHIETSVKYAADRILLYKQGGSEETPETSAFDLFFIVFRNLMAFVILNKLVELIIEMVLQIRLGCRGVSSPGHASGLFITIWLDFAFFQYFLFVIWVFCILVYFYAWV